MTITLGVVPSMTSDGQALAALCDALSTCTGQPVHGVQPASYEALVTELERDRVQFAWMSPLLVVLAEERIQLRPLVSAVRGDRLDYRAVLFTDAGGALRSVEDLRGKTIAWVDATSAAGYLYPRLHLAATGVDPQTLFGGELFLRSHGEVVRAVFDGRAQVGATYAERPEPGDPIRRSGFVDAAPDRAAHVVLWTRPIPNDVIVGHGLVPRADHKAFIDAITDVAVKSPQLLRAVFHAVEFSATTSKTLRQLRELVQLARNHGLLSRL